MLVIQNLVNFSVAGNKQNPFSITLYFASGTVPEDLDADVYYDEERTAIASLKPVFETITTRTDAVRMIISGEQMLAASEYSLLYLEISYGGMVQTRGTLKADSRTETTPRQDYFKLHTFGGDEIGVAISESLTQALDIQADVTEKLGEVTQLKADTVQLKADTAQLKADTQTLKADTLQARTDTLQAKADTLQAKTDTQTLKADTLQAKADTLQAKADTQTLKADTAQLKADTQTLKDGAVTAKDDAVTAKDGAVSAKNDAVAAKNNAQQSAQTSGDILTQIIQIATDFTGWIPVFALATDGVRVVVKVTDWAGGHGTKPAVNVYLGATGPVTDIAQAVDIRGPIGFNWMGDHSTGTPYAIGDAFVFRGSAYRVNVAFTGAFDRSKVTRILRGTNPVGAWTATTQYYIDDLVTDSGNTYRRLTDGVSGASFSGVGADWAMWAQKGDPGTLTASAFTDVTTIDDSADKVVIQSNTTLKRVPRTAILTTAIDTPDLQKSLNLDFVGSGSISRRISTSRIGVLSAFDRRGNLVQYPANIPAIAHDLATGKRLGLSSWKTTDNKTNNSNALGGTAGILGSGGTLPTGWTIQNVTGLTLAVAYGVEFGMNYIEFTATGTATGTTASVIPPPAGSPAAAKGQVWTISTFVRSLSGSAMFSQFVQEFSTGPGQGYIAGQTAGDVSVSTGLTRLVYTVTIANVTAAYANAGINLRFTTGQTYNQTVRLYGMQFELSDVATPFVPSGVGATATRGDETITLPATNIFSQSEGCIVFQAIKSGTGGRCFTLASAGGGNIRLTQEGNGLRMTIADDAATVLSTIVGGNIAIGSMFRATIAWAKDDFVFAINGTLIGTASAGAIPAFATLTLGNVFFPFNSYVQKVQGYSRRGTNTQAVALSRM